MATRIKARTRVGIKKKSPIKAGSTDKKSGGIFTSKVIAIAKKRKKNE